jgi:hypothetical protein
VKPWGEKFQKIGGVHQAMITESEHTALLEILCGKKTRKMQKHNPEFPVSNLIYCDCEGKWTGVIQGNGHGNWYPKYKCRKCGRQLNRSRIQDGVEALLGSIEFPKNFKDKIISCLEVVWKEDQQQNLTLITNLERRLVELNATISNLVLALAENPTLAQEIKKAVAEKKVEVTKLESQIAEAGRVEEDLVEFTNFALDYLEEKRRLFWRFEYEEREKCKQLAFPGEIYVDFSGNVYTKQISPILNLKAIKKEAQNTSDSSLVHLIRNSLHTILEESKRWRIILHSDYEQYKLDKLLHPTMYSHFTNPSHN